MSRQVGALWPVTNSENEGFEYSGYIDTLNGQVKIGIFKNTKKKKDNQPTHHIVKMDEWSSDDGV